MIKETVLKNGLRVITDHIPHVETVSLGAWYKVGARCETPGNNGISHVLEHMAFKGTTTRTALDISQEIENVGGYLNAYTSKETTAYYARVLKDHTHIAADILSDILQNSTFQEDELNREKGVIIQEIGQSLDTPDDVVFDHFQSTCFQNQPMGRTILGPVENVQNFTRDDIESYMGNHYAADKMVFAAAGNVDHDDLVDKIGGLFDHYPPKKKQAIEPATYHGGDYRQNKDLEQIHMVLGFEGMPIGHKNSHAQMVLSTLLGGGMSSRLFQEVREKRGLVYTIQSFASSYSDAGVFTIYAGTGPDQIKELIPVVIDELRGATNGIKSFEMDRAKAQLKAGLLMGLESTSNRCERLANQMLFHNRHIAASEIVEKIDAVTIADMESLLTGILSSKPTLATLGPIHNVMEYGDLEGLLK